MRSEELKSPVLISEQGLLAGQFKPLLRGLGSVIHFHIDGTGETRSQRTFPEEDKYTVNMFMHVYMFIDV